MSRIPDSLRAAVEGRAKGQCEYCQSQQSIVVDMEIDHIQPEVMGGKTTLGNLCLACVRCNKFKRDHITGVDPLTGEEAPLFNPRMQQWADHFRWSADQTTVIGITATGRATTSRLKFNDLRRVLARRRWVMAGWHPPKE